MTEHKDPTPPPAPHWFRSGLRTVDEIVGRNVHLTTPRMVYLRAGETKKFLVIDADLAMIGPMHRKKVHDVWVIVPCNNAPGLQGGCAFCSKNPAELRAPITVLDIDGYTDAAGKVHKYLKRIWLADDRRSDGSPSLLDFLTDALFRVGTLRGLLIHAHQKSSGHNGIGEEFMIETQLDIDNPEFAKKLVEKTKIQPADLEKFEYTSFIRPVSNEWMRRLMEDPKPPPREEPKGTEEKT